MNKILYSLRLHIEQLDYLRKISKENFTTVTQYIIDLIKADMSKHGKDNRDI